MSLINGHEITLSRSHHHRIGDALIVGVGGLDLSFPFEQADALAALIRDAMAAAEDHCSTHLIVSPQGDSLAIQVGLTFLEPGDYLLLAGVFDQEEASFDWNARRVLFRSELEGLLRACQRCATGEDAE